MPVVNNPCRSAYFFSSERDELQHRLRERRQFEPDLFCLLYGLRTHSSSVVIHLVLSNEQDIRLAQAHKLNCLGYGAREYSSDVDSSVRLRYPSMSQRETITIQWNNTKQGEPFCVFARPTSVHSHHSGMIKLEVKILDQISPFRQIIPRHYRRINGDNIESESSQEDDNVEQESLKTSDPEGKIKGTFSTIIKSIEYRIKNKLADGNSVKSQTDSTGLVQVEFKHHSVMWRIKFEQDKVSKYDVKVEMNRETTNIWEPVQESLLSKNIISAVRSRCGACQSDDNC